MAIFTVHEAKTQLSRLIQQALDGEDVVIARGTEPVVRLVAVKDKPRRVFGALKGRIAAGEAFFEPLPEDELRHWDNG